MASPSTTEQNSSTDFEFVDKLDRDLPKARNDVYAYAYEMFNLIASLKSQKRVGPVQNRILLDRILKCGIEHLILGSINEMCLFTDRSMILNYEFLQKHHEVLSTLSTFKNRKLTYNYISQRTDAPVAYMKFVKYDPIDALHYNFNPNVELLRVSYYKPIVDGEEYAELTYKTERKCSNFRVYPDKSICAGCSDCVKID